MQPIRAWKVKTFKNEKEFNKWVETNQHRVQWQEIFINNVYRAVEYKKLTIIDIQ